MQNAGRLRSCLAVTMVSMVTMGPLSPTGSPAAEPAPPSTQAIDGYGERLDSWTRTHHTAIHDYHRDQMVIFGGHTLEPGATRNRNDVWTVRMTGTDSFEPVVRIGLKPPGRHDHSAIYDPIRRRMIVFGGRDDVTTDVGMNDTWAYSFITGNWEDISPGGTTPATRHGHTAIYDPVRDRMIIYGGTRTGGVFGDVWALALSGTPSWSQVQAFFPPRRWAHTAIYDSVRDRMVVDGGYSSSTPDVAPNDTWALDLTSLTWSELTHTQPVPTGDRVHHRAVYDVNADRMLVWNGRIWEVPFGPAGPWSELAAQPLVLEDPPSMVYDRRRDHLILHGGSRRLQFGNLVGGGTRILPLATLQWSQLVERGASAGDALYVPSRDWFVVAVGSALVRPFTSPTAWVTIDAGMPPPFIRGQPAIHDPLRDQVLVFGGDDSKTWSLDLSGTPEWSVLTTTGAVPAGPRSNHTTVHDKLRDRMIVYGGTDGGDLRGLDLETLEWTELFPSGPLPPDRGGHVAIMDPVGDRMIVFGGSGFDDLWALNLSPTPTWQQLSPLGIPPTSSWLGSIYDPVGHRMIVSSETGIWSLSLAVIPAWRKLTIQDGWSPYPLIAYDSTRDRVVIQSFFQEAGHHGLAFTRFWELNFPRNIGVSQPPAPNLSLAPAYPNPSSGSVRFQFHLARQDDVTLRIHDLSGRVVATLVDGSTLAGPHDVEWSYARGFDVAPGVYFADLRIARSRFSRRFVIVR